jgi:hypothetical protein
MNRHRELQDAKRTVLWNMANGVAGGRCTYWCRKGEVNLKLFLAVRNAHFLRACLQDSNSAVEFTVL